MQLHYINKIQLIMHVETKNDVIIYTSNLRRQERIRGGGRERGREREGEEEGEGEREGGGEREREREKYPRDNSSLTGVPHGKGNLN